MPTVNRFKVLHDQQAKQPARRYASTIDELGSSTPSPFVHDDGEHDYGSSVAGKAAMRWLVRVVMVAGWGG